MKLKHIRVFDVNDNGFLIEASGVETDAKALRARIYAEMKQNMRLIEDENVEYELYIRAQSFDQSRFVRDDSIDDLTLMEIGANPDHPYRHTIVFDKKRHPRIEKAVKSHRNNRSAKAKKLDTFDDSDIQSPVLSNEGSGAELDLDMSHNDTRKNQKLVNFFGGAVPKRDGKAGGKLTNFFGEPVAVMNNAKLMEFFGETDVGVEGKKKRKKKKAKKAIRVFNREQPKVEGTAEVLNYTVKSSNKLESFFGKRLPGKVIEENLDLFFPGLKDKKDFNIIQKQKNKHVGRWESFDSREFDKSSLESIGPLKVDVQTTEVADVTNEFQSRSTLVIPSPLAPGERLGIAQSASVADFLEAFATSPDIEKQIQWVQGPLIGAGAFGKVFYGANRETGELMAVKQVPLRSGDPKLRKKMMVGLHLEIALLKDLKHDNIVRYLGYNVENGIINVFLEYVSGGSITSALSVMGAFEEPLVKSVTAQILDGLDYLHKRNIIHRDIKGANVLMDEEGNVKLSDFGISKRNSNSL